MANLFVRQTGNDSNNGTSAALAWRTITKAVGAAGIASGDVLWIGGGTYRETVTFNMTSPVANTRIVGDVDGAMTGDAGDVVLTAYTAGDWAPPSASSNINLNGRDFLSFEKLHLQGGIGNPICFAGTTADSTTITLSDCTLFGSRASSASANVLAVTLSFGIVGNWTIERCRIFGWAGNPITVTLATGIGSDWDANIIIRDCLFTGVGGGSGAAVLIGSTGTSANEGGGVKLLNNTVIGTALINTTGTRTGGATFTVPCTVANNLTICAGVATAIAAAEAGPVVDLGYNRTSAQTAYGNVTQHATSRTANFPATPFAIGHESVVGSQLLPYGAPLPGSPLISVGPSSRTTDLLNRPRPEGDTVWGDTGTATAGATTTITDTGKAWGVNQWVGWLVKTTGGTGAGQLKRISSNTATALTISGAVPAGGLWATTPAAGTTYLIYQGSPAETGKSTAAGTTTTLTDGGANWSVNLWAGYVLAFTGGTGSGQTATIASNTATVLTFSTVTTAPDATTTYSLYASGGIDTPQNAVGCFERHDGARRETVTTDAGGVGIVLHGPQSHEFLLPVDATTTTISIKGRYDSDHGTTNKPQALLLANGEVGVTAQTLTMSAAVDTWETLTFSAITPTAKGVVTVRLLSRSVKDIGRAYFDTWGVT